MNSPGFLTLHQMVPQTHTIVCVFIVSAHCRSLAHMLRARIRTPRLVIYFYVYDASAKKSDKFSKAINWDRSLTNKGNACITQNRQNCSLIEEI